MNYSYTRSIAPDGEYDLGNPHREEALESQIAAAFPADEFITLANANYVVSFNRTLTAPEEIILDDLVASYIADITGGNNDVLARSYVPQDIASGKINLSSSGDAIIQEHLVSADTIVILTAQAAPSGSLYVVSRIVGVSITLASTAGASDDGLEVAYNLLE